MEIQQLRHLLAAAHHGCLLKAAEASNITQSGLSRSITSLEARLGVPLLVRKPKGVEPTVFGLSVLERARVIVNEVGRSIDEVRAIQSGQSGEVCLGITQNYGLYLIPTLLNELGAERPNVRYHVVTGGFLDLVAKLKAGSIDVAFGLLGPIDPSADLVVEPLREHHSRVIARVEHPLTGKRDIPVEALSAARWATLGGEGFQRNFINFFELGGHPAPFQCLKTDSIELIRRFILNADALTVLPADVVKDEIDQGLLTILDCETPGETTQLGLMLRAGALITPQVKLLIDRLRTRVAAPMARRIPVLARAVSSP